MAQGVKAAFRRFEWVFILFQFFACDARKTTQTL
jgi:hypothetical protein